MDDVELTAQMYQFGPLHESRFEIQKALEQLPLQTGDLLYRSSNAKGPFGLPFSKIVGRLSKSHYTHAAIVLQEKTTAGDSYYYVLEVSDQGTVKYRLIDWLDSNYTKHLAVYRLKQFTQGVAAKLEMEIKKVLDADPDYDFSFDNPTKFYCTEAVAVIYKRAGYVLVEPEFIKDIVPKFVYHILRIGNWFFKTFTTTSLPLNERLYYVGNKLHGLMSSNLTHCIYEYSE